MFSTCLFCNKSLGANETFETFPVGKRLRGLLQYYAGYGESLIDYNVRTHRLGIGILVADWL